jgi:hypothetical protein
MQRALPLTHVLCTPEFMHFLKLKIKSTLRAIVPRGVR